MLPKILVEQTKLLEPESKQEDIPDINMYSLHHLHLLNLEAVPKHLLYAQHHHDYPQYMDFAPHKNVGVCWNCNNTDLEGEGLEYNFDLVKDRFADIVHVRELNVGDYPYQQLMDMLVEMKYKGWILLECRTDPEDRVQAMVEQREIFESMIM